MRDRRVRAPAVAELVSILRQQHFSVLDLLEAVADAKKRHCESRSLLDEMLEQCLEQTSLVHEMAIENMLHGFCELDADGLIIYANQSLSRLIPGCEGRELATFFGDSADEVRHALTGIDGQRAARLTLTYGSDPRPVRAEFGALRRGKAAAYTFITDLTAEEEAKRKIYEATGFAIVRLDPDRNVTYANAAACRLLNVEPDMIVGVNAADFVASETDGARMEEHLKQRQAGIGSEYDVKLLPFDSATPVHVRVRSIPEMDCEDHLSGMFVTISAIETEVAAKKMQAEIAHAVEPRALFNAIAEIVKTVVPFDYASLSVFADHRAYSRGLFIHPDNLQTDARWIAIPPDLRTIHESRALSGDDLAQTILAAEGGRELHDHKAVQEFLSAGQKAWIPLAISGDGWDAVLTLTRAAPFEPGTREKLDSIGLENAMHAVLRLETNREAQFRLNLIRAIADATTDATLAALVVKELASFYGWQNVAIFKVNETRGRFMLVDQAAAPEGGYRLPDDHSQPLSKGFLGKTLRGGSIFLVGDAKDPAVSNEFVCGACETRSEMCVPIRVQGKIVWILNIEDRRPDAFKEPDKAAVEALMQTIEPSLERALIAALLDHVLEGVPDAAVITDTKGAILKWNVAAEELLGGRPSGMPISRFFNKNSKASRALAAMTSFSAPIEGMLTGLDRTKTAVLIRAKVPRDEFDRRLVLIEDRDRALWQADTRRISETLGDLSAEVRVPLSLVSTFLREIRRHADDVPIIGMIADHAIAQLDRVDLAYEQVAGHHLERRGRTKQVSLNRLLERVAKGMEKESGRQLVLEAEQGLPPILAEERQLESAVRSMIAYLLRVGDLDAPVTLRARNSTGTLTLTFFKPHSDALLTQPPRAERRTNRATAHHVEEARALRALDEPRLEQLASSLNGVYRRRRSGGSEMLRLLLRSGG